MFLFTSQCDLEEYIPVKMTSAHPHVDPDGTVWNVGTSHDPKTGYAYAIIKYQKKNPNWSGELRILCVKYELRILCVKLSYAFCA